MAQEARDPLTAFPAGLPLSGVHGVLWVPRGYQLLHPDPAATFHRQDLRTEIDLRLSTPCRLVPQLRDRPQLFNHPGQPNSVRPIPSDFLPENQASIRCPRWWWWRRRTKRSSG